MIKKMVELRGREAQTWLESLKPDSDELNALFMPGSRVKTSID